VELEAPIARVMVETFEGAGYVAAGWGETVGGGSTVNEDEPSANAGNPPGWGAQCLLVDRVSNMDAFTLNNIGAQVIAFVRVELALSAFTLSDGDAPNLFLAIDSTAATLPILCTLSQTAGVASINVYVNTAGGFVLIWSEPVILNKVYRFEWKMDTTNDLYAVWVQGVPVGSGVLTGTGATNPIGFIDVGCSAGSTGAFTCRYDNIEVDNSDHIGPDDPDAYELFQSIDEWRGGRGGGPMARAICLQRGERG
jgi:hypothetical protein